MKCAQTISCLEHYIHNQRSVKYHPALLLLIYQLLQVQCRHVSDEDESIFGLLQQLCRMHQMCIMQHTDVRKCALEVQRVVRQN